MLSIMQNAQSWINVFTKTSKIHEIELRVTFDFFVQTSFQQYAFLQNRLLDKNQTI